MSSQYILNPLDTIWKLERHNDYWLDQVLQITSIQFWLFLTIWIIWLNVDATWSSPHGCVSRLHWSPAPPTKRGHLENRKSTLVSIINTLSPHWPPSQLPGLNSSNTVEEHSSPDLVPPAMFLHTRRSQIMRSRVPWRNHNLWHPLGKCHSNKREWGQSPCPLTESGHRWLPSIHQGSSTLRRVYVDQLHGPGSHQASGHSHTATQDPERQVAVTWWTVKPDSQKL